MEEELSGMMWWILGFAHPSQGFSSCFWGFAASPHVQVQNHPPSFILPLKMRENCLENSIFGDRDVKQWRSGRGGGGGRCW